MNTTTVSTEQAKPILGVDSAKNCFQLVKANERYRIEQRHRLTREKFVQFMSNHPKSVVIMEACGGAQYWGRQLLSMGHEVKLLPAQHVRAYVRRNKTDTADAAALIEASRCEQIKPVAIKSIDQQVLQQLHRLRFQWQCARTARINSLRGMLREFGIDIAKGAVRGLAEIREALELADNGLPDALRPFIERVLGEIGDLAQKVKDTDRALQTMTHEDIVVQRMQQIPGVGPLISTGIRAAVADIQRFGSGRHFASWLGLTPREHSSGEIRRLGRISKQGDVYLRAQLIHGARSVLAWANVAARRNRNVDRLRHWAVQTEQRVGRNKAAVALANKLARIIWATWKYERDFKIDWSHLPAPKVRGRKPKAA